MEPTYVITPVISKSVNGGADIQQKKGMDIEEGFYSQTNPLFKGIGRNQATEWYKDGSTGEAVLNKESGPSVSGLVTVNVHSKDLMELGHDDGPNLLVVSETKKRRQGSGPTVQMGLEMDKNNKVDNLIGQSQFNSVEAGSDVGTRRIL